MEDTAAKQIRELERDMAVEFGWSEYIEPYAALRTPTSIRLLKVRFESPIRCSFKEVDLNKAPSYSALSYTWGNPRGILPPDEDIETDKAAMDMKYPILCDGTLLEVSANCHAFLLRFQQLRAASLAGMESLKESKVSDRDVEYIWVDAICINQNSLSERASQVCIMDRVYRQARKVLIWLGHDDVLTREGSKAMFVTHKLYKATVHAGLRGEKLSKILGPPGDSPIFKRFGLPRITPFQWQGLIALFRRTWFVRAWTIQEFALAREPIMMCGTMMSSWTTAFFLQQTYWAQLLTNFLEYNAAEGRQSSTGFESEEFPTKCLVLRHESTEEFNLPIFRLHRVRKTQKDVSKQRWGLSANKISLQQLLSSFFLSESFLPEDRIYALIGLVPQESWDGLEVDYRRSTAKTYIQATWAMIRLTGSLRILSHVENKSERRIPDLPSWVPDYSAGGRGSALDNGIDWKTVGVDGPFDVTNGSLHYQAISDIYSRTIAVRGFRHCTVEYVGKGGWNVQAFLEQPEPILQCVRGLPRDHFWRTILYDHDIWDSSCPASARSAQYLEFFWLSHLSLKMRNIERLEVISGLAAPDVKDAKIRACQLFACFVTLVEYNAFPLVEQCSYETVCKQILEADKDLQELLGSPQINQIHSGFNRVVVRVNQGMAGRVMFTTSSHTIGKGPDTMLKGDEVWILQGARVPYLLRPQEAGRYEFVGEAYIQGIMKGRAHEEHKGVLQTITLV